MKKKKSATDRLPLIHKHFLISQEQSAFLRAHAAALYTSEGALIREAINLLRRKVA
jgi:hypothetical protein